jgi:hypothetical protein
VRVLILAVLSGCAAVGGPAAAADLQPNSTPVQRGAIFAPAGQIVEWDFEPGVVVRAYWLPPYLNRHYFPTSGVAPQLGRKENLESTVKPEPAKSFYREWSSSPVDFGGPAPVIGPQPAQPSLK